jgi:Ribosomal protein L19.
MFSFTNNLVKCSRAILSNKSPIQSLYNQSKYSIVYGYVPKRSPFDKTNYVDYYVPPPTKYHKTRKPRLPQWDDPNVIWPPVMAAPTKNKFKELIQEVEMEEKKKIEALRPFKIPDMRSGDIVEFHMLHSLSEGKGNTLSGILIGRTKRNSLHGGFNVIFRFCGVEVIMNVKQYSPLLANLRLVARGSGNLRSKLNYLKHVRLSREELSRPIIKNTVKRRKEDTGKGLKAEGQKRSIKLDSADDQLL